MAHTPGPWKVLERLGDFDIETANGELIAELYSRDDKRVVASDARLIAAAPELLEAAQSLVTELSDGVLEMMVDERMGRTNVEAIRRKCDALKDAIDKAEAKEA